MELVEITDLFRIDVGAPSPLIISDGYSLYLAFIGYEVKKDEDHFQLAYASPQVIILKFNTSLKHSFGLPNNEILNGHPYYNLGMESHAFYILKDSDLLKQIEEMNMVHPGYKPSDWDEFKHYILTFHDNMFECIARDFEYIRNWDSIYEEISDLLAFLSTIKNTKD